MGISKDNAVITLVINRETVFLADEFAHVLRISRSEFIRRAVEDRINDFNFISGMARSRQQVVELTKRIEDLGFTKPNQHGKFFRRTDIDEFGQPIWDEDERGR